MALPFSYSGIALRMPGRPRWRKGIRGTGVLTGHGFVSKRGASRLPVTCGGAGGVVRCASAEWENGNARLEEEVFEFMEASQRPNHFPTKEELLRSGRADLVHAIVAHGGWLAAGWDSEEAGSIHVNSHDADVDDDDSLDDEYEDEEDGLVAPPENRPAQNTIDVSAEVVSDKGGSEESGIAAMLTRLERERMLSYSEASTGRKGNGGHQSNGGGEPWLQPSSVNSERKVEERSFRGKEILQSLRRESTPAAYENTDLDFRENLVKPKRWGVPSVRRIEDLEIGTEGEPDVSGPFWQSSREIEQISPQTVHIDDNTTVVVDRLDDVIDNRQEWTWNVKATYSGHSHQIYSRDVPNTIMSQIQKLEGQLVSALGSLRSGKDGLDKNKVNDKKVFEELEQASDALEFRETEIMKMRAKLRSTRAKLAALEGKMAMEIMEVRKAFEEKQKKVEEAHKVLRLLRTARIVWPNSATEVFLAGSFDGWTSQRRMGKSNAGVFVISLQLYPGRYEIKFIVDGVWKVDPQRPVVYDNGFENNLLVIY